MNFYRDLIKKFSRITYFLNKLLRKEQEWTWKIKQERVFRKLKKRFTSELVLITFNEKKLIIIKVDVSVTNQGIKSLDRNKVNPAPGFNEFIEFKEFT